jgi:hypothetical protein
VGGHRYPPGSPGKGILGFARTKRKLHKATGRIFYPRSHLRPQPHTLIPHMPAPPQEGTPSLIQVHRLVHLPYLGLQQQGGPKVSEYCSCYETPFQENSLPNKLSHLGEFLIGLTTCLFNQYLTHLYPGMGDNNNNRENGYGHPKQ